MEITFFIDKMNPAPLYAQLYQALRAKLERGELEAGARLPSVREMARLLGVSRNTVEGAYQQLIAEGYVESKPRSGLRVLALEAPLAAAEPTRADPQLGAGRGAERQARDGAGVPAAARESGAGEPKAAPVPLIDFRYGDIDAGAFPLREWRRCLHDALELTAGDVLMYGQDQGDADLRAEIAKYLERARGVKTAPELILLCPGTQQAIALLCQLLSLQGGAAAMEDPGYAGVRAVFVNNGCRVQPIPLDADGICTESVEACGAPLLYITPSHQLPFGMVLPIQKRYKLLQWANQTGSYIIEDDYDSEFRYIGQPIPALKALDTGDRVIYLGTFSKSFLPSARMSYLVLPEELYSQYRARFAAYNQGVSPLLQKAVYLMMQDGRFERHIRKMRKVYQEKHRVLLQAVDQQLGGFAEVVGERAGLHILLKLKHGTEQLRIQQAAELGVKIYGTAKYWIEQERMPDHHVLLGFGGLTAPQIQEGIRLLKQAWS
ncbi:PLP-dependent aminotransferase family protein [Paenibacillus turpanensis]|uniref:MocR-like pyridoxine biosynthesis transcription factor PdxR n=1 Tax=Paenibacillus turpanensis TaxID=2689078 RepID=UPI001408BC8F|nr:PLP-dependent aminotransferase family protein [Paenibacillus turpanensis]